MTTLNKPDLGNVAPGNSTPPSPTPAAVPPGLTVAKQSQPQMSQPRAHPLQFYVPSNWHIEADEDGIIATNNSTGDTFAGTQKEFSEMLRSN